MKTIFLDPGHGDRGGDFGAIASIDGTREADITLKVAKKAKEYLEKNGYKVILSREKEITDFPIYSESLGDLPYRVQKSNDAEADLFISIHCNSASVSSATGTEIYYTSNSGQILADLIMNEILYLQKKKKKQYIKDSYLLDLWNFPNRGVIKGNFYVLSQTDCPAILIETLFLSNRLDLSLLKSEEFQNCYALAIASGVSLYFGEKPKINNKPVETIEKPVEVKKIPYEDLIRKYSKEKNLRFSFIAGLIEKESSFRPKAVSISDAKGLMQLKQGTFNQYASGDIFDPENNIRAGCSYLSWLKNHFGIDQTDNSRAVELLVSGAYNQGQNSPAFQYAKKVQELSKKYED